MLLYIKVEMMGRSCSSDLLPEKKQKTFGSQLEDESLKPMPSIGSVILNSDGEH